MSGVRTSPIPRRRQTKIYTYYEQPTNKKISQYRHTLDVCTVCMQGAKGQVQCKYFTFIFFHFFMFYIHDFDNWYFFVTYPVGNALPTHLKCTARHAKMWLERIRGICWHDSVKKSVHTTTNYVSTGGPTADRRHTYTAAKSVLLMSLLLSYSWTIMSVFVIIAFIHKLQQ